mgnify:CR=1 FL=1
MVSTYIANGEMDTEFIPVESEHSSMSAAIGAEAAGARSLTATSSAGLALMWEELLLAASNRLPLALTLVNRTLSGPININCDHSDGMGARDTGWIQIYAENNQEAYDNFIQAYPIAEDKRVHLPIMICQDGFITSHAVENIELMVCRLSTHVQPDSKGNLNFNCLLMLMPDKVLDYVVVHELCHLKQMNHSKKFWMEVERYMPDYQNYKKWLNENGGALIERMLRR